jgi:hypothetical protein
MSRLMQQAMGHRARGDGMASFPLLNWPDTSPLGDPMS